MGELKENVRAVKEVKKTKFLLLGAWVSKLSLSILLVILIIGVFIGASMLKDIKAELRHQIVIKEKAEEISRLLQDIHYEVTPTFLGDGGIDWHLMKIDERLMRIEKEMQDININTRY